MTRIEKTADLQQNHGLNCAQSLLTAYGDLCGIDAEQAKAIGRPFGGGIASTAGMCGHLTAGLMLLSMFHHESDEKAARKLAQPAMAEFLKLFKEKHGYTQCKDLLGADMSTPEGKKQINDEKLVAKNCYGFGRGAAAILEVMLNR